MNFRLVFKLTGKTLLVEAGALLLPLLVCLFYRENPLPFLLSIAMTGAVGLALSLIPSNDHFFPREGFFAVALIWLLMSAFGALPFFFSGFFPSYVDCFFESVSGFTTTGASILTAVEPLPRGILFWRSFMHWMGGMGVLILTIALLPSLGGRTLHVMRAESPGPIVSKLVPKTSQSSKILYGIYCALTLLEVFCLRIAGMPWYDSLVHSFATAGTGGFSTRNLSIAAYESPAIEVIITLFMLIFSINFALYFLLLCGKVHQALRSDELRFFLAVVAFSTLLISINIWPMRTAPPCATPRFRWARLSPPPASPALTSTCGRSFRGFCWCCSCSSAPAPAPPAAPSSAPAFCSCSSASAGRSGRWCTPAPSTWSSWTAGW